MPKDVSAVRCPKCGATDAGEAGGVYEFTEMRCAVCGYSELCDHYQIKDNWNVSITLPDDATPLPAFLPPASGESSD